MEHKSLADLLAGELAGVTSKLENNLLVSQQVSQQVTSKLESDLLVDQQVTSKLESDLLELKQVVSKLQALLSEPAPCKAQIGFRLQLAAEPELTSSQQQRGGLARAARMTPERRREIAMLGVAARRNKQHNE